MGYHLGTQTTDLPLCPYYRRYERVKNKMFVVFEKFLFIIKEIEFRKLFIVQLE